MSPTSLLESKQKTSDRELNPKLKAVLASFDVQIEDELTRYRRYRRSSRSQQQGLPKTKILGQAQKQTLELVSGAKADEEVKSKLPEVQKLEESKERSPLKIDPSPPGSLTVGGTDLQEEPAATEQPVPSIESPKGLNDYLESSERLLKSLDSPTEPKPKERSAAASLLTPVGILSMVIFTLSGTALGIYARENNYLGLGELFKQSGEKENTESVDTANTGETGERELPESPLNSSQDFVELNLDTLGSISPSPSPIASLNLSPSIPPPISGTIRLPSGSNSGANGGGLNGLGTTLLPQTGQPNGNQPQLNAPLPPVSAPQEAPQPKPPTPAAVQTPIQSGDGWFYVVKEYAGENSLERAREIVPDAYIRQTTDGPKIQMGALLDAESAKQLLKELEEKGISAEFYEF